MTINLNAKCPFQPGTMITAPEKFWGRAYEKTTLISRLQNMGSSVINGDRRIGKSSLAYFVYMFSKSNLPNYEPIWIDCQNIYTKSVDGLFQQIKANSSLNYSSGKTKQECLKNFVSMISKSGKKIVIFVDEFELLTDASHKKQFDESFYMQLRMLAAQGGNLALVLVSKEPLQEICKHTLGIASPFYNIFTSIPLSLFSEEDVHNFLKSQHDDFKFSRKEIKFVKSIEHYRHPLVMQVISEAIFINRHIKENNNILGKKISEQVKNYLNHEEVQSVREKEKEMRKDKAEPKEISKPLDILISTLIPVLGIVIIVLEFGLLFQYLDNFKATLLSLISVLLAMVVLIFAGRSIDIISETSFFKLYTKLIEKIPLLSKLLDININKK